jgi:hypothetical protein
MKTQTHNLAKWSLIAGIIIVLNMFFNYAISLVYEEPSFEAYVTQPQVVTQIDTKEACIAIGGQWNENIYRGETMPKEAAPKGYCDPDYTKRMQYEEARKQYERNVFIILVVLGIGTLIGGVATRNELLSIAFSWGGVLSLIIASMRYWSAADNIVKVLILAVALAGLVYMAVRKFGK